MSVTFSIEGLSEENGHDLPCPDCGLTLSNAHGQVGRDFDCSCMGYGGPEELPRVRYELNVHNGNAADILEHLGFYYPDGIAWPQDILSVLSQRPLPSCLHNSTMMRIAYKAAQYGRKVVWS